ncbi:para-aminobenzoate synthetase component 2 [Thalassotalea agarivorans]|uniref:Para-aminobenzoate synthetase component 2 n=2 Tax=Thalassotalea agarivorans TaxID=349064 RepID=A0A1I0H1R0_THASX|nr:para-aminobenzoate synthetase component 2 [Thalassotalea agarivorans]
MIDNYDSFTFNLVRYFKELGQEVIVYRNDDITIEQIEQLSPQAIVISPGPCNPDAAGISLTVLEHFAQRLPILGVCLGHQTIAQFFGANIIKAHKVMHGKTSEITHTGEGAFEGLTNPLTVTRYHSLVIEPSSLPDSLNVTAWHHNELGEQEIMAIEHKSLPIVGVQFHPESVLTAQGHQLLSNFFKKYL